MAVSSTKIEISSTPASVPESAPESATDAVALFRAMYDKRAPEELELIARIQRFGERFTADAEFRQALLSDPAHGDDAARALNLPISASEIRPVWDPEWGKDEVAAHAALDVQFNECPAAKAWRDWRTGLTAVNKAISAEADTGGRSPRFDAWHRRQIARTNSELGRHQGLTLHPVVAIELSRGCSVGCWFCGVSAEAFGGNLPYTAETAALWRASIQGLQEVLGRGVRTGLCYWATDPLDNPDYPRFVADYHELTGWMPPMTTAVPVRNVPLTREVLRMARQSRTLRSRFSVLSLRILEQIHAQFTPLEMLRVDTVIQTKGSLAPITIAGRALEREASREASREAQRPNPPQGPAQTMDAWTPGTIACVSGFLINMMDRVVRLITPCQATIANPRGYHVLAEARFGRADELACAVSAMIDKHMPERVGDAGRLRFRPDLRFEIDEEGFRLTAKSVIHHIKGDVHTQRLGTLVKEGGHSASSITGRLTAGGGDFLVLSRVLKKLFDHGLLDIGQ